MTLGWVDGKRIKKRTGDKLTSTSTGLVRQPLFIVNVKPGLVSRP